MTKDEFKKHYLGEWKPDPIMNEIIEFVRYATGREICRWKREGLISSDQLRLARAIISNEND